jgi:uncharacterized membrane protein
MKLTSLLSAIDGFVTEPSDLGLPDVSVGGGLGAVLSIVFTLAGLLSVIFIIVGGVKYTLSGGDASGIKSAKETITYAIVGLIVTFLAFGVVNYVTGIAG